MYSVNIPKFITIVIFFENNNCHPPNWSNQKALNKFINIFYGLQNIAYLQCTRWTYNIDSAHDTKTVRHTDIWKSEIGRGRLKNQHFLLQGYFQWTYAKWSECRKKLIKQKWIGQSKFFAEEITLNIYSRNYFEINVIYMLIIIRINNTFHTQ